jgi:hypothetical protein
MMFLLQGAASARVPRISLPGLSRVRLSKSQDKGTPGDPSKDVVHLVLYLGITFLGKAHISKRKVPWGRGGARILIVMLLVYGRSQLKGKSEV